MQLGLTLELVHHDATVLGHSSVTFQSTQLDQVSSVALHGTDGLSETAR